MNKKKLLSAFTATLCFVSTFAVMPQFAGMQTIATEAVRNDFEVTYEGWHGSDIDSSVEAVDGIGFDNSRGMLVSERTSSDAGAVSSKGFYLWGGVKYDYSVKVKSETDEVFHISLLYKDEVTEEATTVELATKSAKAGEWTEISASYKAPENTYEYEITITTESTNDFVFDDVLITSKEGKTIEAKAASGGLKDAFNGYGFRVGNILNGGTVKNSAITAMYIKDFNAIECENETKADAVLRQNGSTDTNINVSLDNCSAIADFAAKNNIAFRGHAFVWHSQTPAWFLKEGFNGNGNWVTPAVMDKRLESYIKNVFNAFATQYPTLNLYAYDVCNECVSDDSNRTKNNGGAREPGDNNVTGGKSAYVAVYGDNSFVEKAFTYARKYAPEGCKLFYNDYNEYWDHKRDCIINTILKPLKEKNLIDGMGMQSHINADANGFSGLNSYLSAMDMYLDLGLEVHVSELDISTEGGKFTLEQQATKYKEIFKHAMEVNTQGTHPGRVTLIQVWGPNDANSWVGTDKATGKPNSPLLMDGNNQPKAAYNALMQLGDGNGPLEGFGGGGSIKPIEPNEYGWYFQCGFEDGTQSWSDRGGNKVAQSNAEHYTEWGSNSLLVSDRTSAWQGASYSLNSAFKAGETYSFSAHVKQNTESAAKFMMKIEYKDASGETAYDEVASVTAPKGKWAQLANTEYTIPAGASGVKIYIETEESLTDFYVDEVIGAVAGTSIAGEGQPDVGGNTNPSNPSTSKSTPGDVNKDGKIDVFDMVSALKCYTGTLKDADAVKLADVDQSGKLEVNDLVLLQDYILGKIKEFPNNKPDAPAVDVSKLAAAFDGVSINSSWKKDGENNVLWTQRFGADPGFMVYKDRLYVFTTNDAVEYNSNGEIQVNTYNSGTINCFSSADLVNWTDHGAIPVAGRNSRTQNGAAKWASFAWAPDACWKTINGKDKFFLYFADSAGGIGVVTADSPEGPYRDELGHALINKSTAGYGDVEWLFDPAVLVDDDGNGYLYCGGGVPSGKAADPGTARAVKLGADMMSLSGSPAKMNPPYLFEDSSILKVDGKYYYSYCTNWSTGGNPYGFGNAEIGVMVADNPLGPFTYKGIALKNPAAYQLDGGGNNHHSIVEFKGKYYMLYHSRNQSRAMNIQAKNNDGTIDLGGNYRSCHLDNATFSNGMFSASGSMKGVEQIQSISPYQTVQAETMSNQSKGISVNGLCDTVVSAKKGEWTKVNWVDYSKGIKSITVKASAKNGGVIKICKDSPKGDVIGYVEVGSSMSEVTVAPVSTEGAQSDICFVFSNDIEFDSWSFTS
ncbi:MAG: endo-1,4-beta-xylanase [Ruminococcus sp.]|nr:endo-1,4-beta-xylanase [Ruminococcus sp.]